MIHVSVEVRDGPTRFTVGVTAPSIEAALNVISSRYPDKPHTVKFPIDEETFFASQTRTNR